MNGITNDHEFMGDLFILSYICNNKNIQVNDTFKKNEIKDGDTIVIVCEQKKRQKKKKCNIF